jgi:hypothetical protein
MLDVGTYGLPLAIMDFEKFKFIVAHPFPPISPNAMMQNEAYLVVEFRMIALTLAVWHCSPVGCFFVT